MNEDELNRLYLRVFNNDDGALVLQDLRNRSYFYSPIINFMGGNEPIAVGFRDGMRSVVLHIETTLKRPKEVEVLNGDGETKP